MNEPLRVVEASSVLSETRKLISDSRRWRADEARAKMEALDLMITRGEEHGVSAEHLETMRSYIPVLAERLIDPPRERLWRRLIRRRRRGDDRPIEAATNPGQLRLLPFDDTAARPR